MNKRKCFVLIVIFSLFAISVIGGYVLINNIFPKANPINYPDIENITMVSLIDNNDVSVIVETSDYEKVLQNIGGAKPTRQMSVNDYPTVKNYYTVKIDTTEREYRYFIYTDNSQAYIEIPYEGIYKADQQFLNYLVNHFKDKFIYGSTNVPNADNTIKITGNSVGEIGRDSLDFPVEILEDDANALSAILNGGNWIEKTTECESDCVINLQGYWTHYDSESGILNKYDLKEMSVYSSKVQEVNGKSLVLSEEDRTTVNTILEKYITLNIDGD